MYGPVKKKDCFSGDCQNFRDFRNSLEFPQNLGGKFRGFFSVSGCNRL